MEHQILHSVRHLDLRSVKEHGQDRLRGMIGARRAAIASISSVQPPESRPQTSGGTPSSAPRRAGAAAGASGSPARTGSSGSGSLRRPDAFLTAANEEHLREVTAALSSKEEQLVDAQKRVAQLEECLQSLASQFSAHVGGVERALEKVRAGGHTLADLSSEYFTVSFPAGAIGA